MRSLLLTCLIAAFSSVVIIASPVPDASEPGVEFPIPLNGITDFNFGDYSSPPQIHGGSQAAEEVLGDSQDLSTAWGDPAPKTPQSDTLSPQQLMFDSSNGNLLAQAANFEDQISSSPTQNPFQKYKDAECGGTKSVCCSGNRIDTSYDEQPGVPLPCSDSMQNFLFLSPPLFYIQANKKAYSFFTNKKKTSK